ncbi:MAG: hypothetical protein ABS59_09930 [Methylobacterium sp. SCN 67-24]|nr:MAG: hypothetical protein ABS59_09930 [Methylobacterium sp. SCN 67-24]
MSTASISRSPFETAPPVRRDPGKARATSEAFTLPPVEKPVAQAPVSRARPDETRAANETAPPAGERAVGAEKAEAVAPAEGAAKADGEVVAFSGEPVSGETKAETGKQSGSENATGEKPGAGTETSPVLPQLAPAVVKSDEQKALDAGTAASTAPSTANPTPVNEEKAQSEGAEPATGASATEAQFLALAANPVQPGAQPVTTDEAQAKAAAETSPARQSGEQATMAIPGQNALISPIAPEQAVQSDGEANAAVETGTAPAETGRKTATPAAIMPAETAKTDSETGEASEAGQPKAATSAGAETKAAERPATTGQAQSAAAADAQVEAPQQTTTPAVQAVPASGPQVPGRPEPQAEILETAAQANARTQAEASTRAQVETTRPTPLHVVPVEIGARALAGSKRFDIRLDPAELGRVDVRLEISDDGSVSAKLTVDRVETLQLLQRDARTLERAFEQAGLKASEGGVEMSLRDSPDQSSRQHRQDEEGARLRRSWVETAEESVLVTETAPLSRAARLGGVDLSI